MVNQNIPLIRIYMTRPVRARCDAIVGQGILTNLQDNIFKMGVLNPLTVEATKQGKLYRIRDGACRYYALRMLADKGKIDRKTYMVPCNVIPYGQTESPELFDQNGLNQPALFDFQIKMLKDLESKRTVAIDIETTGLDFKARTPAAWFTQANLNDYLADEKRRAKTAQGAFHQLAAKGLFSPQNVGKSEAMQQMLYEADFTGAEVAIAHHGVGIVPQISNPRKFRSFDLGDQW